MEQKTNIVLIGMPGVGKSTIGVILAKVLGYSFLDADLLIQEQEGKLLREIIEEKGTDGFIEVENRVNASIRADRAIIATGGSVVYGKEAMEHLKEIGRVVYLKVSYAILEKRLADIKGRGVVLKKGQTLDPCGQTCPAHRGEARVQLLQPPAQAARATSDAPQL